MNFFFRTKCFLFFSFSFWSFAFNGEASVKRERGGRRRSKAGGGEREGIYRRDEGRGSNSTAPARPTGLLLLGFSTAAHRTEQKPSSYYPRVDSRYMRDLYSLPTKL